MTPATFLANDQFPLDTVAILLRHEPGREIEFSEGRFYAFTRAQLKDAYGLCGLRADAILFVDSTLTEDERMALMPALLTSSLAQRRIQPSPTPMTIDNTDIPPHTELGAPDLPVLPEPALPPDVAALLDEASVPGGPYSARPLERVVQLVETKTGAVVREVEWEGAGRWGRSILSVVAQRGAV